MTPEAQEPPSVFLVRYYEDVLGAHETEQGARDAIERTVLNYAAEGHYGDEFRHSAPELSWRHHEEAGDQRGFVMRIGYQQFNPDDKQVWQPVGITYEEWELKP